MAYLGSWKIDDLLTFVCNTHVFATGVATDADSPPTYRVYEDETTTPILTGTMALLDSANTAGFYSEQITLSAANGFEKGKSYNIYISGTVSSVTGTMSHSFQMEAEVDANRINWANIDGPTTTVNLSGTTIKTATDVETDTAVIGALGAGLTAIPWNAAWDAEVQSEVTDALVAYDPPTEAEMNARTLATASYATAANQTTIITHLTDVKGATFSGATDSLEAIRDRGDAAWVTGSAGLDAAGVRAAVGLSTANLDTQLDALPTANENADAFLDRANGIETSLTPRGAFRLIAAASAGKLSGAATTTVTIRNVGDSKDRVVATCDADGNRTAVTTDAT